MKPDVAKLREAMAAWGSKGAGGSLSAVEIKESEGLRPGETLVEDIEGTTVSRTMEAARLDKKGSGLRQLLDERWVVKAEWVRAQAERRLGEWTA